MRFKTTACLSVILIITATIFSKETAAQSKPQYIRIARLVIDSTKLLTYNKALKDHAEAAVRLEPGVIMLYAVGEKLRPDHVTVFEIYEDEDSYKFHIQQPHFLQYKAAVQDIVKSLELVDVSPIALQAKKTISN